MDECPVDYIYESARSLYIHPEKRVNCSVCEPACPAGTIFYEDDLSSEWSDYLRANVDFFNDLDSPGDTRETGIQDFDDPIIAALSPQNEEWKVESL